METVPFGLTENELFCLKEIVSSSCAVSTSFSFSGISLYYRQLGSCSFLKAVFFLPRRPVSSFQAWVRIGYSYSWRESGTLSCVGIPLTPRDLRDWKLQGYYFHGDLQFGQLEFSLKVSMKSSNGENVVVNSQLLYAFSLGKKKFLRHTFKCNKYNGNECIYCEE